MAAATVARSTKTRPVTAAAVAVAPTGPSIARVSTHQVLQDHSAIVSRVSFLPEEVVGGSHGHHPRVAKKLELWNESSYQCVHVTKSVTATVGEEEKGEGGSLCEVVSRGNASRGSEDAFVGCLRHPLALTCVLCFKCSTLQERAVVETWGRRGRSIYLRLRLRAYARGSGKRKIPSRNWWVGYGARVRCVSTLTSSSLATFVTAALWREGQAQHPVRVSNGLC